MNEAPARRASIRRRLLLFLVGSLLLTVAGASFVSYWVGMESARDAYDRALLDPAIDIAENIKVDAAGARVDLPRRAVEALVYDHVDKVFFQVRAESGRIVDGVDDLPPPPGALEVDQHLFFDGVYHGDPVRIAALRASNGFVVQVGETLNKRNRLVKEILLAGLIPTLLVAGVSIGLAWVGVARGLQPLERVRNHLLSRRSGDLSPIPEIHAPIEILPVVDAFNGLLGQLRLANELQQRFLANAAHQLRTPLAGLQMHLELLSRRELPPDTRAEVGRMHGATARAGHLASQLLALARAEGGSDRSHPSELINLRTVADDAAHRWAPKAIARNIDLGFALEAALVPGDAVLIPELLDNLIDNALLYTPEGGTVTVATGQREGTPFLSVEDTGPGIPAAERGRVTERFYRVPGTAGDGSGLGLAIVKEIADRHGATIEVSTRDASGGTRVRVEFLQRAPAVGTVRARQG
ncbi:MAG: sensor histidine kinase [Betaproteobacteria bacterium]|nr:sensor histidine kinase [Betaproteobacteria bacterium]